jgi:methanogenic corrinoid protein MtbC1
MVGGYPFNIAPNLWQSVGADGYARDAQQAVTVAESLVK